MMMIMLMMITYMLQGVLDLAEIRENDAFAKVGMGNEAWPVNFDDLWALSGMDLRVEKNFPIQMKLIKSGF